MASFTINYTIPFGSSLRIGYKFTASSDPYTYLTFYPSYNESPYTLDGIAPGSYTVELTTVCASCSGGQFSDPVVIQAVAQ